MYKTNLMQLMRIGKDRYDSVASINKHVEELFTIDNSITLNPEFRDANLRKIVRYTHFTITINVDHILCMEPTDYGCGTAIQLDNGNCYWVLENYVWLLTKFGLRHDCDEIGLSEFSYRKNKEGSIYRFDIVDVR